MGTVIAFVFYTLIILSVGMYLQASKQNNKQDQKKRSARVCVTLPKKFDWDI